MASLRLRSASPTPSWQPQGTARHCLAPGCRPRRCDRTGQGELGRKGVTENHREGSPFVERDTLVVGKRTRVSAREKEEPDGTVLRHRPSLKQQLGHGRSSPRTFWGAARRQGLGRSLSSSQRLDPDGWLRRYSTDLPRTESPAAWTPMHRERQFLTTPAARNVSGPGPVPIRVLDSGLLMGGTFSCISIKFFDPTLGSQEEGSVRRCPDQFIAAIGLRTFGTDNQERRLGCRLTVARSAP